MRRAETRKGIVLIAVLASVVLLSLAAYQYGELMIGEYRAADSAIRAAQSRSLAISGVHYAAAALADQNTMVSTFGGNVHDNSTAFRGIEVQADDRPRFAGKFSLVAPPLVDDAINGSTQQRFGVVDEASKININALVALDPTGKVAHDVLIRLPNMTEEIADAMVDWVDADDEPRPSGAENQFYSILTPGYRCKNGPLDSLEELLLVRGVTKELLFGTDRNRNGRQDSDEDSGEFGFDPGWAAYLTVYSRELNRDMDAQPRIYLNDSDINSLYDKLNTALGEEMATWIVAYRLYGGASGSGSGSGGTPGGQLSRNMLDFNRRPSSISSIYALVDGVVSIPQPGGSAGGGGGGGASSVTIVSTTVSGTGNITMTQTTTTTSSGNSGGGRTGSSGQSSSGGGSSGGGTTNRTYPSPLSDQTKLRQILPQLLDKCTTRNDAEIPARINVRTAPRAVLSCLPGLDEADVQAIIDARPAPESVDPTDPIYQTSAWLKTEANLTTSKIRALERYITGRSQTYRVQSLGYFDQGGPVARIEAVVDTNAGSPRIVYFRDLTELGRGGDVPR